MALWQSATYRRLVEWGYKGYGAIWEVDLAFPLHITIFIEMVAPLHSDPKPIQYKDRKSLI